MDYEFPPSQFVGDLASTVVIHCVLLSGALLPLILVGLRTKRRAKSSEVWYLALAMTVVPLSLFVVGRGLPGEWVPFLVLYSLFFEFVASIALIVIGRRLRGQGQATPVLSIIGSLMVLGFLILCLLPATPSAREAAKRMQCSNNIKNLAVSLLQDEQSRGSYMPVNLQIDNGPLLSWRVELLPFLERRDLFETYDRTKAWDSEQNFKVTAVKEPPFVCPSNPQPRDETGRHFTAYARPAGDQVRTAVGGQFEVSRSNTIAIVEACGQNIVWTEPRDAPISAATVGINLPGHRQGTSGGALSSYHTGGATAAMLDGSTRFLSKSVDKVILERMLIGVSADESFEFKN